MSNEQPNTSEVKSNLDQVRVPEGSYFIGVFGGKPRYIRYDLNAFAEMESIYGSMEKAQERLQGGSMSDVRTVLWLGLIWNEVILDKETGDPIKYTLSKYQVGSWLTTMNLQEIMNQLQNAITGSLPDNPGNKPSAEVMNNVIPLTEGATSKN